jgi:hypothetical protein
MWLSETAVDTATLETLAFHDIKFTILSPFQARRFRKIGDADWEDAAAGSIDPKKVYKCQLPSGRSINLFFYNGAVSQEVAFDGLLNSGERFANRLKMDFTDEDKPQLVHIATDGESYGHHHQYGEMALSYCLYMLEEEHDIELTIYGEYLERFPPEFEVMITEGSSWSCDHGVERWKSNCGCNTGGHPGWKQDWRGPLREAFDWLRDELILLFEREMGEYDSDPWELRNDYIQVITNRSKENNENFLAKWFGKNLDDRDKVKILSLLEMQYHSLLMYTSCGWFFDEVSGLETVQDILYAARAIQLAEEFPENRLEQHFLRRLECAPSNLQEVGNSARVYEKFVRPMTVDLVRVGAHYAIASLFENFPSEMKLFNFKAVTRFRDFIREGKHKMVIGHTAFQSNITLEQVEISFAMLHLGELNLYGGVREFSGLEALDQLHTKIKECFRKNDIPEIFSLMDYYFGSHTYSFWHLFKDEQNAVLSTVMQDVLENTEGVVYRMYEDNVPILKALKSLHLTIPHQLKVPVDLALNTKLGHLIKEERMDMVRIKELLESATALAADLDLLSLNYLTAAKVTLLMRELADHPFEAEKLEKLVEFLAIIEKSPIQPEYWEAQNIAFRLKNEGLLPSTSGEPHLTQNSRLLRLYDELSQKLNISV